jgi:hypothetical protein
MNNDMVIDQKPIILSEPGNGFQSRDVIYTISKRLASHTAGKIVGGYGPNGRPLSNRYALGNIAPDDALYATEYALTRGLNPYGHIHMWYHRSGDLPPQLIIDVDWKILKGWAEWRSPFGTESVLIDSEDRSKHGLKVGDIGYIVYVILDSDRKYFHQYVMTMLESGKSVSEARLTASKLTAKAQGLGIVRANEMVTRNEKPIPPPKGRSWEWRAETRALRDAIRRSHGEPPPAQIRAFSESNGTGIDDSHLSLMANESHPVDLAPDDQQRYFQLEAQARRIKEGGGTADTELANSLMRNNGDDDPLDLSPEPEPEPEPEPDIETGQVIRSDISLADFPDPATAFWAYQREWGIDRQVALDILSECGGDFGQGFDKLQMVEIPA